MVGKTFSSRVASAARSNGFSVLAICATMLPLRKILRLIMPVSSFASWMQRVMLSGLMPKSVPLNFLLVVVITVTCLSASAASSVKSFLCATDTLIPPNIFAYDCAFEVFIFDLGEAGFEWF